MNEMEKILSSADVGANQSRYEKFDPSSRPVEKHSIHNIQTATDESDERTSLSSVDCTTADQNHAREDLPNYRVCTPSVHDVTFGKGGRMHFPGNEAFRAECQRLVPLYLQNPKTSVRDDLAVELISIVYNRGGRFLVVDPDDNEVWKDAGFDLAIKKAKQLLSDAKRKVKGKGVNKKSRAKSQV